MEEKIPDEKNIALRDASKICFSDLWLIPNRSLISISDAKWSLIINGHQPTVRNAMIASLDFLCLIVGGMVLLGIYMGFYGDFGIVLSRISNSIGNSIVIQVALLALSPWVALIYFFNWSFRQFLKRM